VSARPVPGYLDSRISCGLRLTGLTTALFLGACHPRSIGYDAGPEGVLLSAQSVLTGAMRDTLSIWIKAVNTSREPRSIGYASCATARISSLATRSGKPVHSWDYATNADPRLTDPNNHYAWTCGGIVGTTLMPKDSLGMPFLSIPVAKILGDSLPSGRYRVVAYPVYIGPNDGIKAGEVELRAPGR
jgi:hypothetical protein